MVKPSSGHLSSEAGMEVTHLPRQVPLPIKQKLQVQVLPVTVAPEVTIARVGAIYEGAYKQRCTLIERARRRCPGVQLFRGRARHALVHIAGALDDACSRRRKLHCATPSTLARGHVSYWHIPSANLVGTLEQDRNREDPFGPLLTSTTCIPQTLCVHTTSFHHVAIWDPR
jgi:hypothetical protein